MKPRTPNNKKIHEETYEMLTSSSEVADVIRGDGRWKHDRRHVYITEKPEAAPEYLT